MRVSRLKQKLICEESHVCIKYLPKFFADRARKAHQAVKHGGTNLVESAIDKYIQVMDFVYLNIVGKLKL